MRRLLFGTMALGLTATAFAQGPARPEPPLPRVAVVDLVRVWAQSQLGKSLSAQIDALQKSLNTAASDKQKALEKMDADIAALQSAFDKQSGTLAPDAAEQRRQEIVKKSRDRQAFVEDSQAEIQRKRDAATQRAGELRNNFLTRIQPYVNEVAKEKHLDIVLTAQAVHFVAPVADVTPDVIQKADAGEAASAAAPKPATAPKPASPKPAATPKPGAR
jgi:Skp family chaperone for outer membrane proteins